MSDLHIHIPAEMHTMLRGVAKSRRVSVEEFIRTALEAALACEDIKRLPNAVTQKAMRAALEDKNLKTYTSVDQMMNAILSGK